MSRPSTIAARCAALSTSIAQVIPDLSNFARKVRDARHDLNALANHLVVIRTGLSIAQDDFSSSTSKLPSPLVDAVSQILDSCDDSADRLHKGLMKLSFSPRPKVDWQIFKDGSLTSIRQDLEGSKMVLELAVDYLELYGQENDLETVLDTHLNDRIAMSEELLKRTDTEEIEVNLIARDRLPSLLHAIRLLRSCILAISREGKAAASPSTIRRTSTPRPDSLEPVLGESRRSVRESDSPHPTMSSSGKGIGTWLADIPLEADAQPLRHSRIIQMSSSKASKNSKKHNRQASVLVYRTDITPSRSGTFYTDDGSRSSRTLLGSESRLKRTKSWCSGITAQYATQDSPPRSRKSRYPPSVSSCDVSVFHKNLTSDKIAVAKENRKNMEPTQRTAVDRILANIPADATVAEVERILWEGANPIMSHPEFGYFFIRAAYEMSPEILRVLMEFGADITKKSPTSKQYHSAMHAAALGNQLPTIKYLVSLGHALDITNENGETPLLLATKTPGAFKVAQYLAEMGADVNHKSNDGETPLYIVLTTKIHDSRERSRLIELLLSCGAEGDGRELERRGDTKGRMVLGLT